MNTSSQIQKHLEDNFTKNDIIDLRQEFSRNGLVKVPKLVPEEIKATVHKEILRLLDDHTERRDITLETTDNTPRHLNIVKSDTIKAHSPMLVALRENDHFLNFLGHITEETLHPEVTEDEEFVITRQDRPGDTHGWHWGDYSFALIWIVKMPPVKAGGMLQCIPHTYWNKENARINQYICDNPIRTYSFVAGDIYLLKADTTLHRTVPLTEPATRIMLNMTWASERDYGKLSLQEDDRWWENTQASKAHQNAT
ncbi:HalD/BesD family halogenase [Endozoicomonas euniceicola]|uniref:ArpA protein n=1 Tax=Endozoicomonas euniceicola TaxID=1234143 RepID=A0ABY6GPF2_9GAMM|nr:hypothetical protein [Endozoicomonas euniceicola]UYM14635.1 hypothetical protein NX720_17290 [Endozoicomonas euniceicola]